MQNTHLKIWLFLSLITPFFYSQAQSSQRLLQQADSLFNAKDYSEALNSYQNLFNAGSGSAAAYLKAAYLCEASARQPEALIYLYRYYLLQDDAAAYAKILELAEQQNLNGYERTDNDRLRQWIATYSSTIAVTIFALAVLSITFLFSAKRKQNKPRTFRLAFLSLVVLVLLFLFNNLSEPPQKAVILSGDGWLMNGPSPAADRISAAPNGDMVEVVGQSDIWIQIKLSDGKRAYIKQNLLTKI